MAQEQPGIERRLDALADRLERVERRLAELDGLRAESRPADRELAEQALTTGGPDRRATPSRVPALLGYAFMILAGAFALRTLTESGTVPAAVGVGLGGLYGCFWLWWCDRAGQRDDRGAAAVYGTLSAMIVLPLLVEATTSFELISSGVAAAALMIGGAGGLAIAARRRLVPLIWTGAIGTAAAAIVLAFATRQAALFAAVLFVIAPLAFAAGSRMKVVGPGWVTTALLDALLLLMVTVVLLARPDQSARLLQPTTLVILLVSLVALSFAAFIARTWRTRQPIRVGEVAQGIAAGLIGFGGALAIARRGGAPAWFVGAIGLMLAAATYSASFTFIDRLEGRRISFIFYTSSALVFTLFGAFSIWQRSWLALALSAVALATAIIGSRRERETLSLHATIYLLAAALASGLAGRVLAAAVTRTAPAVWSSTPAILPVLVVCAVFCWLPIAGHGRTWGALPAGSKLLVLLALVSGLGAGVLSLCYGWLPRGEDGLATPAALAVARTALLSGSALALAWLGGRPRWREAAWLVYPILVLGGLKLLIEDLGTGRTVSLALSFALYGLALIVAPRWVRRLDSRRAPTGQDPTAPVG